MNRNARTYKIVMIALFTALIAVGAFIKIPIPVVPFTMQVFFVILSGMVLGKTGAIAAAAYMLLGLIGVPIFTEGGGIGYVFKPTFGYIIGFIVGSFTTGAIVRKSPVPSFRRYLAAGLAGIAVIYVCGLAYMYPIRNYYLGNPMGVWPLFLYGLLLTLPGDIVCCFLAAVLTKNLRFATKNATLTK